MSRSVERIICAISFGILYGLMIKYFGFQVTLIILLMMIFIELFVGSDKK